ncbi:MAG: ATP-binding protein [Firmicutes bacterium]|nr:ATP-binding protein [Bacillota bacterium]
MTIAIPNRLKDKLLEESSSSKNGTWHGDAVKILENVENYYAGSPEFFPDYTSHGTIHIEKTLELADKLIPDETMKKLKPRDIAVLIGSIAAHDLGMFITDAGVEKLLAGEFSGCKIEPLDKLTWEEAWEEYKKEVKRFNDRQLINMFNQSHPVDFDKMDISAINKEDIRVYGEFFRRYHPRLSHHIALEGFPGSKTEDIFINTGELDDYKDIIGLIARSHGMNMLETEDYIKENYGRNAIFFGKIKDIPVFYLMSVLRLADYLDAGEHRAPIVLEHRQEIEVPLSKDEWKWNQCINFDDNCWDDLSQGLNIHADPDNSQKFNKIEQWLKAVQREIDLSWALLAEKYTADVYKLSIHRITSNILDKFSRDDFNKKFVIKESKIKVNHDIVKLLIAPLYGDDPSYGVRELLQNAVDACRERKKLEEGKGNTEYIPKVVINIDTKKKIFTITDNGTGMNEDILLNYFLTIGASFRNSDSWKKNFAPEDGKTANVVRTGKFGIGVLAGFLLGISIHVETKHIDENLGYSFDFGMDNNVINIERKKFDHIGTRIVIKLSDKAIKHLKGEEKPSDIKWYEWYVFKDPDVRYYFDGNEMNPYAKRIFVPQNNDVANEDWFIFESSEYESLRWRYTGNHGYVNYVNSNDLEKYYCNGIVVPEIEPYSMGEGLGLLVWVPSVSVVDKKCRLKLDLSRKKILEFPDEKGVIKELYKYILARLLICNSEAEDYTYYRFNTKGSDNNLGKLLLHDINYLLTKDGFTLFCPAFVVAANTEHIVFIDTDPQLRIDYNENIAELNIKAPFVLNRSRAVELGLYDTSAYITHKKLLQRWEIKEEFNKRNRHTVIDDNLKYSKKYDASALFYGFEFDGCNTTIPFDECKLDSNNIFMIEEIKLNVIERLGENNVMLNVIKEYLGDDIWIPYNFEDRKKKFPKAFKELAKYMKS